MVYVFVVVVVFVVLRSLFGCCTCVLSRVYFCVRVLNVVVAAACVCDCVFVVCCVLCLLYVCCVIGFVVFFLWLVVMCLC